MRFRAFLRLRLMYTYDDVFAFLVKELRVDRERLSPDTDLRQDLGVDGSTLAACSFQRHTTGSPASRFRQGSCWRVRMPANG